MALTTTPPTIQARAVLRYYRASAFKVREVLDLIRGKSVEDARAILRFGSRGATEPVLKLLNSAAANAESNSAVPDDELYVAACYADEGPTLKRWRPRARGRATRIRKRTCHITIVVARYSEEELERLRRSESTTQADRRRRLRRRREQEAAAKRARKQAAREAAEHDHEHEHAEGEEHDHEHAEGEEHDHEHAEGEEAEAAEHEHAEGGEHDHDEEAVAEAEAVAPEVAAADELVADLVTEPAAAEEPPAEGAEEVEGDVGPYGAGSAAARPDGEMPEGFPIKGNESSKLYHVPGSRHYDQTIAEVWFATVEDAEAAGFRAPKGSPTATEDTGDADAGDADAGTAGDAGEER